ncbi:MAG: hypothetical protein ABSB35_41850 [Bryobacteraceae bacterium]|jgi:hypothetical protein
MTLKNAALLALIGTILVNGSSRLGFDFSILCLWCLDRGRVLFRVSQSTAVMYERDPG